MRAWAQDAAPTDAESVSRVLAAPSAVFKAGARPCPSRLPPGLALGPNDRLSESRPARASCPHPSPSVRPSPKSGNCEGRWREARTPGPRLDLPEAVFGCRPQKGPGRLLPHSGPFRVRRSAGAMASQNGVWASGRSPRGAGHASRHSCGDRHAAQAPCGPHSPSPGSAFPQRAFRDPDLQA